MAGDTSPADAFAPSRGMAEDLFGWLETEAACALDHAALETALDDRGRKLLCRMFQDQMDLRALREARVEVVRADGTTFGTVETGRAKPLLTTFDEVTVERLAYRHRGQTSLYPGDGELNLPTEAHSHGVRRLGRRASMSASARSRPWRGGPLTTYREQLQLGRHESEVLDQLIECQGTGHNFSLLPRARPSGPRCGQGLCVTSPAIAIWGCGPAAGPAQ